jgi:hypothetical protein
MRPARRCKNKAALLDFRKRKITLGLRHRSSMAPFTSTTSSTMFPTQLAPLLLLASASGAFAQHDSRQIAEDALRHRSLARAQELSAKCFAEKNAKECLDEMKKLCVGLTIGKYCGLRQEAISDPVKSLLKASKAHVAAAQCMDAGKPYEDCVWDLQTACKGIGIGKDCGMVHAHSF